MSGDLLPAERRNHWSERLAACGVFRRPPSRARTSANFGSTSGARALTDAWLGLRVSVRQQMGRFNLPSATSDYDLVVLDGELVVVALRRPLHISHASSKRGSRAAPRLWPQLRIDQHGRNATRSTPRGEMSARAISDASHRFHAAGDGTQGRAPRRSPPSFAWL